MSSADQSLVVVGASLAGLRAVEAARKAGHTGRVTLIGAETHLPYDRPPLSKAVLEGSVEPGAFREESFLRDDLGVDLRLGTVALSLNAGKKILTTSTGEVTYDALVVATGTVARSLPHTPELVGVHALRTMDDALAVRTALLEGARTVVIGAGFIGSEVASSARKLGRSVTIVEASDAPLARAVGSRMGTRLASMHGAHGTSLLCGRSVARLEGDDRVREVVLDDGTRLPADLVVVGIGVEPAVTWLSGSGLTLENGVRCDATLWTGAPGVYAAGDVASWPNQALGIRQRMENWTAAAEQGAAAARNALNPEAAAPYQTVPYYWSDWYGSRIQFVGAPEADELVVVDDRLNEDPAERHLVALYRRGARLIGALTVNGQSMIMKYRGMIMKDTSFEDALAFAEQRKRSSITL